MDTGLKMLRDSDRVTRDLQGPQAAWKQLNCAAALSGYALAALSNPTPDHQESSFLMEQALNALNGQTLGVECPVAPRFPNSHGRAVDMHQGKEAEKKILISAMAIAERMKQRDSQPAVSSVPDQTAKETPDEKMRRIQRELNEINSKKITAKTQQGIDQQEMDRKALAKLILANNRIEKGEFVSVGVDIPNENDTRRPRPRNPVPVPQ